MKKTRDSAQSVQMTRREFVGRTLLTAGAIAGAPALLRGQNLNSRLNIAFIACGGRASASLSELTIVPGRSSGGADGGNRSGRANASGPTAPHPDENVVVLCDVNQTALDSAAARSPPARK